MSVYYLVVNRAAPETGHSLLSIESTVDPNVTATLKGDTVEISAPDTYGSNNQFSLNFEQSKLAKVYAKTYNDNGKVIGQVELTSDLVTPALLARPCSRWRTATMICMCITATSGSLTKVRV